MWHYLQNCFVLLIPILIWNLIFFRKLPEALKESKPQPPVSKIFDIAETLFRIIVFSMTLFMKLELATLLQKAGLLLYVFGVLLYFISWVPLIGNRSNRWCDSYIGLLAPSFTPVIWLFGIGLIGNTSFIAIEHISWIFILLSILFIISHVIHTFYVIKNNLRESN